MLNFLFKSKPDYINFGLLFYRLALGISMFYHGYLKYVSGEQGLYKVGAMLSALGVPSGFEVISRYYCFLCRDGWWYSYHHRFVYTYRLPFRL